MSGSVAEALLASGSKKLPLLPPPPKLKKDPRTFVFELTLAESNERTYPEFSWIELVKNHKQKELAKKAESGTPVLNPYASDDEDDLKAMAAKFEAKYNTAGPSKKKKRRVEDYIDRGAGYDESDPFIDNSDVYDEVVPADLQTVHGGFYINSGSLDFKEVELSEDEEDSLSQPPKAPKIKKAKTKVTPIIGAGLVPKPKNPVGRPPGVGNKRPLQIEKGGVIKKKRMIVTPIVPVGLKGKKATAPTRPEKGESFSATPENVKRKAQRISSSSASSSSSSSEDSSSGSDSESSSSEETEEKKETPKIKNSVPVKVKPATTPPVLSKQMSNIIRQSNIVSTGPHSTTQPKRLKTKNVPLNPKLHPNLGVVTSISSSSPTTASLNMTPPPQLQSKVLSKDLMKHHSGSNISPRNQSPSGMMSITTSSPCVKTPLPKSVSTPSISPGVTISTVASQVQKISNNIPSRPKMKNKQAVNSINVSPSQMDILTSLAATGYTMPSVSSYTTNLTPNSSLFKGGLNMVNPPKAMPNLKKMAQIPSVEKLVQKQPKATTQKPVKSKPKPMSTNTGTPPSSHTSAFNTSGSPGSNYLSNLASYKTPPPLAGPGVEISKVRTSSTMNSSVNSTPKTASNATSFSNALGLATVSIAHTSNSNSSLSTNSLINASINSMLSSTANSLVGNVPSSLTVQRLPQSITITPTSQQTIVYPSGITANSTQSEKKVKHMSSFDVAALLQNPVVSYPSTLLGIGNPKTGTGKNSLTSNRDIQQRK